MSKKWIIIIDWQETGQKCEFDFITSNWTSLLCQGFTKKARRNGAETEKNNNMSNSSGVYLTCDDVLILINCFGIKSVLCNLYLTRFDLRKGLYFDTLIIAVFYNLCRCDH